MRSIGALVEIQKTWRKSSRPYASYEGKKELSQVSLQWRCSVQTTVGEVCTTNFQAFWSQNYGLFVRAFLM